MKARGGVTPLTELFSDWGFWRLPWGQSFVFVFLFCFRNWNTKPARTKWFQVWKFFPSIKMHNALHLCAMFTVGRSNTNTITIRKSNTNTNTTWIQIPSIMLYNASQRPARLDIRLVKIREFSHSLIHAREGVKKIIFCLDFEVNSGPYPPTLRI